MEKKISSFGMCIQNILNCHSLTWKLASIMFSFSPVTFYLKLYLELHSFLCSLLFNKINIILSPFKSTENTKNKNQSKEEQSVRQRDGCFHKFQNYSFFGEMVSLFSVYSSYGGGQNSRPILANLKNFPPSSKKNNHSL